MTLVIAAIFPERLTNYTLLIETLFQAAKSRDRCPMRSLGFSVNLVIPGVYAVSNINDSQVSS